MSPLVSTFNFYLALGGVASFLLAAILILDVHRERALHGFISRYGILAALTVASLGTLTALTYSEVFGFIPCGLCWLSRIFLFPQVLLNGVALYFRDTTVARYGLAFSIAGFVISLYHHYLQMGGVEFVRCPTAGASDCAQRFMLEFGFMTFPLLATSGFALLGALYYYMLKSR